VDAEKYSGQEEEGLAEEAAYLETLKQKCPRVGLSLHASSRIFGDV
jgi:hypothetical protein